MVFLEIITEKFIFPRSFDFNILAMSTSFNKRKNMALYYFTADYSGEAFSGMVNSPQDREAAARKLIEAVGMKLHNFYFCVNTGQIIGMIEGTGSQMSTLDMVIMASGAFTCVEAKEVISASEMTSCMDAANKLMSIYKAPNK